jgi:hypothetical protein
MLIYAHKVITVLQKLQPLLLALLVHTIHYLERLKHQNVSIVEKDIIVRQQDWSIQQVHAMLVTIADLALLQPHLRPLIILILEHANQGTTVLQDPLWLWNVLLALTQTLVLLRTIWRVPTTALHAQLDTIATQKLRLETVLSPWMSVVMDFYVLVVQKQWSHLWTLVKVVNYALQGLTVFQEQLHNAPLELINLILANQIVWIAPLVKFVNL